MDSLQNYVLANAASDYLGVSRSTFYRHIWKKLPRYQISPFLKAYKKSDLDDYASSQRMPLIEGERRNAA